MDIQKSEKKFSISTNRIESKIFQSNGIFVRKKEFMLSRKSSVFQFVNDRHNYFYRIVIFITTKLSISRYLAILKSNRLHKTIRNLSRKWMARMCMQMIDFSTVEPPRASSLFLPSSYYYKHILSRTVASYLTASSMLN